MKKIRYNFKGYEDKKITVQNTGRTNSPKRTATTHWIVYSSISNKTISFDIDNRAKYFDVDYDLNLTETNREKTYTYKNQKISRESFINYLDNHDKK